jgi:hypothetical protein
MNNQSPPPIDDVRSNMADALDRELMDVLENGQETQLATGEVTRIRPSPAMLGVIARRVRELQLSRTVVAGSPQDRLRRMAQERGLRLAGVDTAKLPDVNELETGT